MTVSATFLTTKESVPTRGDTYYRSSARAREDEVDAVQPYLRRRQDVVVGDVAPAPVGALPQTYTRFLQQQQQEQQQQQDVGNENFLSLLAIVFAMLAICSFLRQAREDRSSTGAIVAQAATSNTPRPPRPPIDPETAELGDLTGEERREFIEKNLPFEVVAHTGRKERSTRSLEDGYISVSVRSEIQSENQSGRGLCAICLQDYCDGDEVCYSTNDACPHTFHKECMVEWLERVDHCPCCRQKYLPRKKKGTRWNKNKARKNAVNHESTNHAAHTTNAAAPATQIDNTTAATASDAIAGVVDDNDNGAANDNDTAENGNVNHAAVSIPTDEERRASGTVTHTAGNRLNTPNSEETD